jgi:hypothetical protein
MKSILNKLKVALGFKKPKRTMTLKEFNNIKEEYTELYQIANANARWLRGNISVVKSMMNACGIRYAKKRKPFVDKMYIKLKEELYYVEHYEHICNILEQGRIPKEISSQY